MSVKNMIKLAVHLNYKYDLESIAELPADPAAIGNQLVKDLYTKLGGLNEDAQEPKLKQTIKQFKTEAKHSLYMISVDYESHKTYTKEDIANLEKFIERADALKLQCGLSLREKW